MESWLLVMGDIIRLPIRLAVLKSGCGASDLALHQGVLVIPGCVADFRVCSTWSSRTRRGGHG